MTNAAIMFCALLSADIGICMGIHFESIQIGLAAFAVPLLMTVWIDSIGMCLKEQK